MSPSRLSQILLSLPHVEQSSPFGPEVLVQKVGGKMFACYDPASDPIRLNLKCDPDRAISLREENEAILPGYHMNKRHWNTLILDQRISAEQVKELIEHSYELVFSSLPKKVRAELK